MIAILEGTISEIIDDLVILNVNGVGYGVLPAQNFSIKIGEQRKLYIHEHIREESHDLFGFIDLEVMQLFKMLISVSGVGPKVGAAIVSTLPANEIRSSIAQNDIGVLTTVSGVGKRVAERIVLDLKNKIGDIGDISGFTPNQQSSSSAGSPVIEAMESLGFQAADARTTMQTMPPEVSEGSEEDQIKWLLRELSS